MGGAQAFARFQVWSAPAQGTPEGLQQAGKLLGSDQSEPQHFVRCLWPDSPLPVMPFGRCLQPAAAQVHHLLPSSGPARAQSCPAEA